MKIVKINGKEHKTTDAIADYIKELEYYYEFRIGGRVIEVHYGLVGKLIEIFKDFNSIPSKILGGCHKAFLKELKIPISDKLKNTYWFLVQSEDEKCKKKLSLRQMFRILFERWGGETSESWTSSARGVLGNF